MNRAVRTEYRKYADRISADIPGAVFPLSVIEGIQSGDIYEDGGDLLIWHRCGFAFVTEGCGTQMLDFAYVNGVWSKYTDNDMVSAAPNA